VTFGFAPLSCGIEDIDTTSAGCALASFVDLPSIRNSTTEKDFRAAAEELGRLIFTYVVPLFKRVTSDEIALSEWKRLDEDIYKRHQLDKSTYIIDLALAIMAIAVGDYDFAIKGLQQQIDCDAGRAIRLPDYESMIERLRIRDMDWINSFVRENERISRITLGLQKE